jgi:hypothetical protein
VAAVEWAVNRTPLGAATAPPWAVEWDTRSVPDGPHTIVATAIDEAGNATVAPAVEVVVRNGPPPAPQAGTQPVSPSPVAETGPVASGPVTTSDPAPRATTTRPLRVSVRIGRHSLAAVRRDGLRLRVACTPTCRVDARLVAHGAIARRLPRPLARRVGTAFQAERASFVVRLPTVVRRRLRTVRRLRITVVVVVQDRDGRRRTLRRAIVLR